MHNRTANHRFAELLAGDTRFARTDQADTAGLNPPYSSNSRKPAGNGKSAIAALVAFGAPLFPLLRYRPRLGAGASTTLIALVAEYSRPIGASSPTLGGDAVSDLSIDLLVCVEGGLIVQLRLGVSA